LRAGLRKRAALSRVMNPNKLSRVSQRFLLLLFAMTPRSFAVCVVLIVVVLASVALADDFKTLNGKEYQDATVSRVEPDGVVLTSKSGISKVYFSELPKDVQQRFHYDAMRAAQFTAATQTAISQRNAAIAAQQQAVAAEQRRNAEIQRQAVGQQQQAIERQAQIEAQQEQRQLDRQQRHAAQSNRHVGSSVSTRKLTSPTYNRWQIEEKNRIAREGERRGREQQEQERQINQQVQQKYRQGEQANAREWQRREHQFHTGAPSSAREYERSRRQFENGEGKDRTPGQ